MIRTAPIRYTAHPEQWGRVLRALGCTVVQDEPGWAVYAVGAGILRLHGTVEGHALGATELWLQTDDAEAAAGRLAGDSGSVTEHPLVEPGTMGWDVAFPDGRFAGIEPLTPPDVPQPTNRLSVQPLWLTDDPQGAADDLVALGATRILRSDSGGWANLSTNDGLVATHEGGPGTVLSFEYDGPITDLEQAMTDQGVKVRVIDESYGRTLRFDDPDGGEEIWVSERQRDLYGYREE